MIHALSLIASAVAALGHLLFALAARAAGGSVPRAFARVALALAAWSAAVFLDDLLRFGHEVPWIVALVLPPVTLQLAARLHGTSSRLERTAWAAWIVAALAAAPLALFGSRAIPWAACVLYPLLAFALAALWRAFRAQGQRARGFLLAAAILLLASVADTLELFRPAPAPGEPIEPRFASLASLFLVAMVGTSVARHRLFELKPMLGRVATLAVVALGAAVLLAEALARVDVRWGRWALAGFVLLVFALLQGPLVASLRSPAARARVRRRRALLQRLAHVDDLLARAGNRDELQRGLESALARDPEVASVALDLHARTRQEAASSSQRPARGELVLPLRAARRIRGVLRLSFRDQALARSPALRRALRSLASRVAVTASALELQEEKRRTERLAHLGALAASLAHEIKNPLGAILGALELLDPVGEPAAETERRRWLDVLRQEAQRLDRTVSDALALGRAPKLELRSAAPREVAESARMLAQERASQSRVELSLRAEGDALRPLELDADQLRHALLNLLLNAILVQPEGGRVELVVEGRGVGNGVRFHVRDDGPGIAEELRVKVFEPFFTTRPTGSGIGLAVAQRVAAAHGGSLEIAAPDGGFRGAHFVLTIPATEEPVHGA